MAEDAQLALGGADQVADGADQRRLAGAVGPEQAEEAARARPPGRGCRGRACRRRSAWSGRAGRGRIPRFHRRLRRMRAGIATCENPPVPDAEGAMVAAELERRATAPSWCAWDDPASTGAPSTSSGSARRGITTIASGSSATGCAEPASSPASRTRGCSSSGTRQALPRELGGAGLPIVPTVWSMPEHASSAARDGRGPGMGRRHRQADGRRWPRCASSSGGADEVAAAVERIDAPAWCSPTCRRSPRTAS